MNKIEFVGELGGDNECFCFWVDKETYIKIHGQEDYDREVEYINDWNKDIPTCPRKIEEEMKIYPGTLFGYQNSGKKMKIKIEFEEV